jgi:hypothetical protein
LKKVKIKELLDSFSKSDKSLLVVAEVYEKEWLGSVLNKELKNAVLIDINKAVRNSLRDFLNKRGVECKKSKSNRIDSLAEVVAEYVENNDLMAVFDIKAESSKKIVENLDKVFKAFKSKFIVIMNTIFYGDLKLLGADWDFEEVFLTEFKRVDVGLWISRYSCWRCGADINVLVGVKIENKFYPVSDFNKHLLNLIKKHFPKENLKLNLRINANTPFGAIANYCNKCGAIIGNLYLFDDIFVEAMPFNFEDVEVESKELDYNEIMNCLVEYI